MNLINIPVGPLQVTPDCIYLPQYIMENTQKINMSFTRFDSLPTELKYIIIHKADPVTLTNLLKTSKQLRELSFYVINGKIASLTGLNTFEEQQDDFSVIRSDISHNALSGLNLISSSNVNKKSIVSPLSTSPYHHHHRHHHRLTTEKTNNVLLSLFSPQSVESKVELYETKCLSNQSSNVATGASTVSYNNSRLLSTESLPNLKEDIDMEDELIVNNKNLGRLDDILNKLDQSEDIYSTSKYNNNLSENIYSCFELGTLIKTRNPLTKKITPITNLSTKKSLPMNLLVDQDSNLVKLTIQLSIAGKETVFEKSEFFKTESASDDSKFLISEKKKFGLMFKLSKGEELPPRSPYDYETLTNYYLDIDNFMINNCYLLKCVEDSELKA